MGEAKRRKQLDATYGNVPRLTSRDLQQKHVNLIVDELSQKFATEIEQIAAAESIINSYEFDKQLISDWLHSKLELYRQSDRTLLASSIMTIYAEIAMKYKTSPLLIKFWYEILKPFLASEKRDRIEIIVKKIDAQFARE